MAHTNATASAIQEMVQFFLPRCADQSTLRELADMAPDDQKWRYAHALFSRIRDKAIRAGIRTMGFNALKPGMWLPSVTKS